MNYAFLRLKPKSWAISNKFGVTIRFHLLETVMCHVSHVRCQVSGVTSQVSHVIFFLQFF